MEDRFWASPQRAARAEACKTIADLVGMSCVCQDDGWDVTIVDLAETCFYDKTDTLQRPKRVASVITAYLDDLVKNP